jgi:glutathione S-transferase
MLTVWGRLNSFNVQKVMWTIGELGLAYAHVDAGGAAGGLDSAEFRAMNPHGRVPVIDDDGVIVWESHAIVRYLAARYGRDALWCDDPAERSRADRWMDWMLATLQPDFMDLFWGFFRTPPDQRDHALIRDRSERCARHYRLLDAELAGRDFLAGDRLSTADIAVATSLYRYFEIEIERPSVPDVEVWYRRLAARPAYRMRVMRPFEELRGRLAF